MSGVVCGKKTVVRNVAFVPTKCHQTDVYSIQLWLLDFFIINIDALRKNEVK